ncbi:hypothetical protein [Rugosimonospora africana]|nr:hypothetical protein [Rugosimonospora africana]
MGERDTVLRSMHDTGLAAWFGGSLMGAVGLNGAAGQIKRRSERVAVASNGWRRWAPVNLAAIGAHLAGASALLVNERHRVAAQRGALAMSATKAGLTLAALGATAYAGALGMKLGKAGEVPAEGPTQSSAETPEDVTSIQRRQRVVQWAVPAFTGALVAISALAGEQQKPGSMTAGMLGRVGQLGKLGKVGMGNMGKLGTIAKPATIAKAGKLFV